MYKPILELVTMTLAAVWLFSACGSGDSRSEPIPAPDYQKVLNRLQEWDLDPAEIGETRSRCYSVNPKTMLVGGGTLEVYEYVDQSSAADAIGQISPGYFDASIVAAGLTDGTSSVHFYQGARLLVIYRGTEARVIEALVSALGPEFADGASAISC